MSQTPPARSTAHPVDQPRREAPTALPASLDAYAPAPASTSLIADADSVQTRLAATRLCVLCGRPLRAGQHMLRVHGSTIHARCSSR
jgi:hypothetical protein